jgi:TolB-like protein
LFKELKRRNVFRVAAAYIVAAWLVIEVSSVILEIYAAPEWVLKILIALLLLGLPLAILFSWVYELTPEGLRKEAEMERTPSITHRTARRLDVITIVLLVAALSFVGFDRFIHAPDAGQAHIAAAPSSASDEAQTETVAAPAASRPAKSPGSELPSIAVLPFADMSPAQDQEYFSDGIAEELLNLLAKVPDLKVAARTSSFRYKGKDQSITEIANTLGVNHVLEGSVRKSGERVRVTAQLIDARDGFHVWSDSFDEDLIDILDVQDRISRQIVEALSSRLGVSLQQRQTIARSLSSREAYDFYLRGNFDKHKRTPESLLSAVQSYRQAVALEPDLAPAWGGLARASMLAAEIFDDRRLELEAVWSDAAERALSLDPNEPQALGAMAGFLFDDQLNYRAGLEAYEKVINADPSDTEAMSWLAQRYRLVGYLDRAEALNRRAYRIDPLSPRVVLGITRTLLVINKVDEARRIAQKAMTDLNGHDYAIRSLLDYHLMSGNLQGAEELADRLDPSFALNYFMMHMRLAAARDDSESISELMDQANQQLGHDSLTAVFLSSVGHYFRQEMAQASEKFDRATQMSGNLFWVFAHPKVIEVMPEAGRKVTVNYLRWIERFPQVIDAYATLGIDILAEIEAVK